LSEEQTEFVKVGFVFSAALTLLCFPAAPESMRWEVFGALGLYPVGVGFFIWPAVGYLLAGARTNFAASACLGTVTFYNYWVAERLTASEAGAPALFERLWASNKLGLAAVAALYVCGQLAIILPKVLERQRCPSPPSL
jgi:hypothetical protein